MTFSRSLTLSTAAGSLLAAGHAMAGDLTVTFEVPQLDVAEYHRPYVALWLESADNKHVADLAVYYTVKLPDREGNKWLKDLRQWWRRSGRELDMPVDGLSRPTLPPGQHDLTIPADSAALAGLTAGDYVLVVEAVREVGGRELVKLPFSWPMTESASVSAAGSEELGAIALDVKP